MDGMKDGGLGESALPSNAVAPSRSAGSLPNFRVLLITLVLVTLLSASPITRRRMVVVLGLVVPATQAEVGMMVVMVVSV